MKRDAVKTETVLAYISKDERIGKKEGKRDRKQW